MLCWCVQRGVFLFAFFKSIMLGCSVGAKPQTGLLPQTPAGLSSCRPGFPTAPVGSFLRHHISTPPRHCTKRSSSTAAEKEENNANLPTVAIACWSKLYLIDLEIRPLSWYQQNYLVLPHTATASFPRPSPGFLPPLLVVNIPQDGGWLHSISQISTLAWMRQTHDSKTLLWLCKAVNGFSARYIRPLYYQPLRAFRSSGTSLPLCPQSLN